LKIVPVPTSQIPVVSSTNTVGTWISDLGTFIIWSWNFMLYVFFKCPALIGICGSSSRLLWLHIDKLYYFICCS